MLPQSSCPASVYSHSFANTYFELSDEDRYTGVTSSHAKPCRLMLLAYYFERCTTVAEPSIKPQAAIPTSYNAHCSRGRSSDP